MDDYLSLRSLEGLGRPFGTGRSSPPSSQASESLSKSNRSRSERARAERNPSQRSEEKERARERDDEVAREDEKRVFRLPEEMQAPEAESLAHTELGPSDLQPGIESASAELGDGQGVGLDALELEGGAGRFLTDAPAPESLADSAGVTASITLAPPGAFQTPVGIDSALSASQAAASSALSANAASRVAPTPSNSSDPTTTPAERAGVVAPDAPTSPVEAGTSGSSTSSGQGEARGESSASMDAAAATSRFGESSDSSRTGFETELRNVGQQTATAEDVRRAGDVLRQFRMQIHPKMDQAVIQLQPAELGRIAIRIEVKDGKLNAVLRAERAETLDVLDRHLPELRAALETQGIEAQTFDLELGFEGQGSEASGENPFQGFGQAGRDSNQSDMIEAAVPQEMLARALVSDDAVDTYA